MYISAHAVVGACTAVACRSLGMPNAVALAASLASHAVLDRVPHHDYKTWRAAIADLAAAAASVYVLAAATVLPSIPLWYLGGMVGVLPDLEIVLKHWERVGYSRLRFPSHSGLISHPQIALVPGVSSQIVVVLAVVLLTMQMPVDML